MKKVILSIAVLAAVSVNAQSEKHLKEGTVKNVRIYQSGAQVDRSLFTSVEGGMTTLYIEGLSANIDPQSVQVTGTGEAAISGVSYQLDYMSADRKPVEVRRLEDSLKSVDGEIQKVTNLEDVYNEEVSLLKANKSVNGANVGVDIDNLREVADFFRERMIFLKNKLMEVKDEKEKLNERKNRLTQQLADLNMKSNRPHGTVVVSVMAKAATKLSLKLSYYTAGASWSPAYEINAQSLSQPVQLSYKADVVQSCNEEWEEVHLVLSTGNPAIGGQKPVLNPWYLNFYVPVPMRSQGAYKEMRDLSAPMAVQLEAAAPDVALGTMQQFVTVQDGGVTTDFEISQPYTVRGDGKPVSVEIRKYELPASYTYYAVPKIDKDAFLLARITGWDRLNLFPGPAKIYFEGNYVGTSDLDPRSTQDTLDLSLGRDKRIVISRQLLSEFNAVKTVGSNTTRTCRYEINVRNTKKDAIELIIEDQLPVTQNSEIKVFDEEYSGGSLEEQTGKVTWRMNLAAGAADKRVIGYSVKHPKNKQLQNF